MVSKFEGFSPAENRRRDEEFFNRPINVWDVIGGIACGIMFFAIVWIMASIPDAAF